MSNFAILLENKMQELNFHIDGNINYGLIGKFQRFKCATSSKRDRDLFVVLHEYDRGATFGDWHYPDEWFTFWNPAYHKPEFSEYVERRQKAVLKKKGQEEEIKNKEAEAREFFLKPDCVYETFDHPYVRDKGIIPYYAKYIQDCLLIPIYDIEWNFRTVQIIKPDGFKRVWEGTTIKDLFMPVCEKIRNDYDGIICICEGYATACSIKEATGLPTIAAISSGNLINVALQIRRNYIYSNIYICADNDKYGEKNVGMDSAINACNKTGARLCYPTFGEYFEKTKPTDFNDLFQLCGVEEVESQIMDLN